MIVYELHGLNDIAVDSLERFATGSRRGSTPSTRSDCSPTRIVSRVSRFIRNARRSVRRRMGRLQGATRLPGSAAV
jgi:hypothetical protein